MNILAVDTAGKTAGVALLRDGRLVYEVYFGGTGGWCTRSILTAG